MNNLVGMIEKRQARVGVIGLGYVGLPLVLAFARKSFRVNGFDIDEEKVERLRKGKSYIQHIPFDELRALLKDGSFEPTTDFSRLGEPDCLIVCVPTPLTANREPDLSYIEKTSAAIAKTLRKGQLVVLESTTYPGTTEEVLLPMFEARGLKAGRDFYLAFSPEREDPGNRQYSTTAIPKVVGGVTNQCLKAAVALYSSIFERVVPVSSTRVAEITKLHENIFRAVNIALANEMKMLCHRMGIDIFEVIQAAATKPFGFMPFYPGPGLGGHCIPLDPFYLTWKARQYEFATRFIELAGEINTSMPYYVVQKTVDALNERGMSAKGAKVLILGIAYKRDVDDMRESPALRAMELLLKKGARVSYNDPYISAMPRTRKYDLGLKSVPLTEKALSRCDCVLIITDHLCYDYEWIVKHARLIVDSRGATRGVKAGRNKIVMA